jgi:FAD/FMN-containing dehydrogenase
LNGVGGYQVTFPGNTTFTQISETYYSAQEDELAPSCIVIPSSIDNVSTFVTELSSVSHLPNRTCSFAVKGGGHAPAAGSANINQGITLDLSSLNQVSLDNDQKIISLGSGLTWGVVYDVLTPLGLAVAGARNSEVGVPGFLIGG